MDNHPFVYSVGIGNFGGATLPQSILHVNSNLTTFNPSVALGDIFRTTGPANLDNSWRMFTGTANGTERFSITIPANSSDVVLDTRNNGAMKFSTNNAQRMHISANTGVITQGFVGIGTSFDAPQSRLHINEMDPNPPVNGGTACYAQWTNTATGNATENEGLRIGLSDKGVAEILQQENLPLIFYTNSIENGRMIPNIGTTMIGNPTMVGIGNWTTAFNIIPANVIDSKLDIDGDLRIRQVTQDDILDMVLVIDPNDHNRVHWRDATTIVGGGSGGVTADNGLTIGPNLNNV